MSEYILSLPDEVAEYFIARFGLAGTKMMGYDLTGEIVRCCDCAYCDKYKNDEIYVCYRFDNEQPEVEPDGYCAWGEKNV